MKLYRDKKEMHFSKISNGNEIIVLTGNNGSGKTSVINGFARAALDKIVDAPDYAISTNDDIGLTYVGSERNGDEELVNSPTTPSDIKSISKHALKLGIKTKDWHFEFITPRNYMKNHIEDLLVERVKRHWTDVTEEELSEFLDNPSHLPMAILIELLPEKNVIDEIDNLKTLIENGESDFIFFEEYYGMLSDANKNLANELVSFADATDRVKDYAFVLKNFPLLLKKKMIKTISGYEMSSGEWRILTLIQYLVSGQKLSNKLILLDEPENYLHPSWQFRVMDVIKDICRESKIMIATHSPILLSNVKTESVFILPHMKKPEIETYGGNIESIILNCFEMKTLINKDLAKKNAERVKRVLERIADAKID